MAPKPKPKKTVVDNVIKPKVKTKTPVYTSPEARKMQDPGSYVDPKTKKTKKFSKQYKA
jgi:hypothetical protein